MRLSPKLLAQSANNAQEQIKLIYKGQLANRILYLKSVSVITSLSLAGSYKYVLAKKGLTATMATLGFAFSPFFLSPIAIAFVFRRYVTELYYNSGTDTYTAHHYGYFLRKKKLEFKCDDVQSSNVVSIWNTFTAKKKPFFVHDEDLIDAESVFIYRKMLGISEPAVSDKGNSTQERVNESETDTKP